MTTHIALLRGINVGGNTKVEMARLRAICADAGLEGVRTYINSGNVLFSTASGSTASLATLIEEAVTSEFDLEVPVLVKEAEAFRAICDSIPPGWRNDKTMRTDVMFLWDHLDMGEVAEALPVREGIDEVVLVDGAVIWKVDAANLTRSGRTRVIGGTMYRSATVRNCNTVRKLASMLDAG